MFVKPKIEEVRRRREAIGWSQHHLSIKAGLSGCAVSRIESGKTTLIHPLRAKALAEALGCNIEEICVVPERSA